MTRAFESMPGASTATDASPETEPIPAPAAVTPDAGQAAAGAAAAGATDGVPEDVAQAQPAGPFGLPGLPVNRAHPFYVGFVGAAGVLTAYWVLNLIPQLSSVLTLIVVALFLALGLEPLIGRLERRGLRRGTAVVIVFAGVIVLFAALMSAVVPAVISQGSELTKAAPDLVQSWQQNSLIRTLDRRYGLISSISSQLQQRLANQETVMQLFGGVYGAGAAVLSGAFSTFTVLVLTLYFTASLRAMREAAYQLVPASRRPRVKLLADEIMRRVGGYIAGQVAVASINGTFTFIGLSVLGLPYPLLLSIIVAIFGLIPLVGATLGAIVVITVALFHSWQYAVIVAAYYVLYQQVENYLIAPRIMAHTVAVPGAVALVAALAGGTLLGVVGALIAIPVAAGILLLVQEVVIPRQARH